MINIQLLAAKFRARIREVGFVRTISEAVNRATGSVRAQPDDFDAKHGTDTSGIIDLRRFRINSPNAKHGARYESIGERDIEAMLAPLPRSAHVVDLGCGKGRLLLIAAQMQFKSVIGVEFVQELAAIAERNVRRTGTVATVVCGDAAEYEFPNGPLAVYMFNPFDATVMARVAQHLQRHKGELWVIYVSPQYCDLFDSWMKRQPLTPAQAEVYASVAIWHKDS